MQPNVIFTENLDGEIEQTCSAEVYEEMCNALNCFEVVPDEMKSKAYFDIDIKSKKMPQGTVYCENWQDILACALPFVEKRFPNGLFCVKFSGSPRYICCDKHQPVWATSFHIIVWNWVVTKKKLKSLAIEMNEEFNAQINNKKDNSIKVCDFYTLKRIDDDDNKKYEYFELFDLSVYTTRRKMRSTFAKKSKYDKHTKKVWEEDRPMLIVMGTFQQSVLTAFIPDDAYEFLDDNIRGDDTDEESVESNFPKQRSQINVKSTDAKLKKLEFFANAGFIECYKNAPHLDFTCFGYALADAFGKEGLCLYLGFAQNYTKQDWKDVEQEYTDKYDYFVKSNNGKRTLGSVYWDFKRWNQKIYTETSALWKHTQCQISIDDLYDPFRVTEIISKTLKETLVLCNENWYMLTDQQLWCQQKECSYYVVKELRKYIDESNKCVVEKIAKAEGDEKEKLIAKSKAYLQGYKDIQKPAFLSILIKQLRTLLRDDTFANKLDKLIGKLAFKNGVMDLETREFREEIRFDDFITNTIAYDYQQADPEKTTFLKGKLLEILNNDTTHLEYFLSIIGFSFIGIPHREKSIYFVVDKTNTHKGDNGKSFFFEIMYELIPCYVYKTNKTFLEEDNKKSHKQLSHMKGMRLVYADEFEEKNVDEERTKIVAEGSKMENEVMFGTSECIDILFKMFVLTNKIPNIKGEAVYNRYKQISCGSHFDRSGKYSEPCPERLQFIADTSLGDNIIANYRNEVFGVIIEYAHQYYKNGYKLPAIPEQFKQDAQDTKKQNDAFALWFDEHCSVGEGKIPKDLLIKLTNMSEKLVKEGMTRLGFTYNKDLGKMGANTVTCKGYFKGGWEGCFINPDDNIEEE